MNQCFEIHSIRRFCKFARILKRTGFYANWRSASGDFSAIPGRIGWPTASARPALLLCVRLKSPGRSRPLRRRTGRLANLGGSIARRRRGGRRPIADFTFAARPALEKAFPFLWLPLPARRATATWLRRSVMGRGLLLMRVRARWWSVYCALGHSLCLTALGE